MSGLKIQKIEYLPKKFKGNLKNFTPSLGRKWNNPTRLSRTITEKTID